MGAGFGWGVGFVLGALVALVGVSVAGLLLAVLVVWALGVWQR